MGELRRIGELAEAAGVPTSTVRFYERRGLLPPDARSPAKYRLYGEAALERLRFIRLAQSTGFALEDIATLLRLREDRVVPAEQVRAMLAARLGEVRRRLAELRELEGALKQSLHECASGSAGRCCPIVQHLSVTASSKNGENPPDD